MHTAGANAVPERRFCVGARCAAGARQPGCQPAAGDRVHQSGSQVSALWPSSYRFMAASVRRRVHTGGTMLISLLTCTR